MEEGKEQSLLRPIRKIENLVEGWKLSHRIIKRLLGPKKVDALRLRLRKPVEDLMNSSIPDSLFTGIEKRIDKHTP